MKKKGGLFAIRGTVSPRTYTAVALGTFVAILALWCAASYGHLVKRVFLPAPDVVWTSFIAHLGTAEFWADVGTSAYRVFMGYALTCIVAIPLGILAGTFRFADAVVVPISEFIRYMPATAFIPLIIVWIGLGEEAKIAVIFIGCVFQMILMVADDTRAVSGDLLHASQTLGANKRQVLLKVLLPALMPRMMNTMRLVMGWAWSFLIAAELFAASSGLGFMIIHAQRFLQTEVIFYGILIIGLLGLILDRVFALANEKLFPWAEGVK
jgi:NitT/TauT family transport system permease protein